MAEIAGRISCVWGESSCCLGVVGGEYPRRRAAFSIV